jgi:hypothetical protein
MLPLVLLVEHPILPELDLPVNVILLKDTSMSMDKTNVDALMDTIGMIPLKCVLLVQKNVPPVKMQILVLLAYLPTLLELPLVVPVHNTLFKTLKQ